MQPKKIREAIRKERGFTTSIHPEKRKKVVNISNLEHLKTRDMKYVELLLGQPIEVLLLKGSLTQVARIIDRDFTTVSKWRKRLGLSS